jgi:hypothetical protein
MTHYIGWNANVFIKLVSAAITAACFVGPTQAAGPAALKAQAVQPDEAELRVYANGAGPAAIFRYGIRKKTGEDVFGVVDPVTWRIQFFTLKKWSEGGDSLTKRLEKRGDCRLPPSFRLWRVHELPDRIVLQSQPLVTEDTLYRAKAFEHSKVVLPITDEQIEKFATDDFTPINEVPSNLCGNTSSADRLVLPKYDPAQDGAVRVAGGENKAFFVSRRRMPANARPFMLKKIPIPAEGNFLASVQELEPATFDSGIARHFIVTSRITGDGENKPGFMTSAVTIVRRGETPNLDASMRLNLGLTRVKTGQKFAAISSAGEVLLIGAADKNFFKFFSCPFSGLLPNRSKVRCMTDSHFVDKVTETEPAIPNSVVVKTGDQAGRWDDAFKLATREFKVNVGNAVNVGNEPCGKLKPCPVRGQDWSPLSELRKAKGIYTKVGMPYAQREVDKAAPNENITLAPEAIDDLTGTVFMRKLESDKAYVFGDIENSDLVGSKEVRVFGIDCSALVSKMWRIEPRIDTAGFIGRAKAGSIRRLRSVGDVHHDDAFVINLEKTLNHIVIFRETRRVGPFDSSRAMLVMESSSSCGGVCWTYYDESFFHGWAIIRNGAGREEEKFGEIPLTFDKWKEKFVN